MSASSTDADSGLKAPTGATCARQDSRRPQFPRTSANSAHHLTLSPRVVRVCVCRGEGLRPAFQLRVRVQGGGFETCVSSSTSASSSLYPGSPGLALPAAARVWSVASASAPRVSSVASSAYQIHNCILLSRTHPRMTRNRTRARPSTRGREVREHDLPSPTLAKRRLML